MESLRAEAGPLTANAVMACLEREREAITNESYRDLLQDAEVAVRQKIYGLLSRSQRVALDEMRPGSLTDIETQQGR